MDQAYLAVSEALLLRYGRASVALTQESGDMEKTNASSRTNQQNDEGHRVARWPRLTRMSPRTRLHSFLYGTATDESRRQLALLYPTRTVEAPPGPDAGLPLLGHDVPGHPCRRTDASARTLRRCPCFSGRARPSGFSCAAWRDDP